MKQRTPQEIEETEHNRLTYELDSTQQHFSTSNEPLINGVPLSKVVSSCACEDEQPSCESCTAQAFIAYKAGEFDPEEEEIENYGEDGICLRCKEWTQVGESCCGDEYVHIN